jgi:glycosyltransferase involved in cell wall biosynthesis
LSLEPDVTFTGFREDIPEVLRALSVLAIPSKHEATPQAGLQALATQTPVVGSNVGGIPEIIRPGETGRLFPVGDAPALAAALRETLEDSATTRRYAEKGRALVASQFSVEVMLDKLEALYHHYLA